MIKYGIILIILIISAITDIKKREIPHSTYFSLFTIGILDFSIQNLIIGILLALPFFIIDHKKKGMGMADGKLVFALGFVLGFFEGIICIIASLISFIVISKIQKKEQRLIPFAPFLTLGYILTLALEVLYEFYKFI